MNKELEQLYAQYSQVNDISRDVFLNSYEQFGDTYINFIQEALKKKENSQETPSSSSDLGENQPTPISAQGNPQITSVPISQDLDLNQAQVEAMQGVQNPASLNLELPQQSVNQNGLLESNGEVNTSSSALEDSFNNFIQQGGELPLNPTSTKLNVLPRAYENQFNNRTTTTPQEEVGNVSLPKKSRIDLATFDTNGLQEIPIPTKSISDELGNVVAKINNDVVKAYKTPSGQTILQTGVGLIPEEVYLSLKDKEGKQRTPQSRDVYENINGVFVEQDYSEVPIDETIKSYKNYDYISSKDVDGSLLVKVDADYEKNLYLGLQAKGLGKLEFHEDGTPKFKINKDTAYILDSILLSDTNEAISTRNAIRNSAYISSVYEGAELEKNARENFISRYGQANYDRYGVLPPQVMDRLQQEEMIKNYVSQGYTEQEAVQYANTYRERELQGVREENNFILNNIFSKLKSEDSQEKTAWITFAESYPKEFRDFFNEYTEKFGDEEWDNRYLLKRFDNPMRRASIKDEFINYLRTLQVYSQIELKNKAKQAKADVRFGAENKNADLINQGYAKLNNLNMVSKFIQGENTAIAKLEDQTKPLFKQAYEKGIENAQLESSANRNELSGVLELGAKKIGNFPVRVIGNLFQSATSFFTGNSDWSKYVNEDIEFSKNAFELNKNSEELRTEVVTYKDKQGNIYKLRDGNIYKVDKNGYEFYKPELDNNSFKANLTEVSKDKEWNFTSVTAQGAQLIAEVYLMNRLGTSSGKLMSKPFGSYAVRIAKELGTESRYYNILKSAYKGIRASENASPFGMAAYTFGGMTKRNNELGYDGLESWFKGIFDSGMMYAANRFFPDARFFKDGDRVQKTAFNLLKNGDKKGALELTKNFFIDASYYAKTSAPDIGYEIFEEMGLERMFQGVSDVVSGAFKQDKKIWEKAIDPNNFVDLSPETALLTALSTGTIKGVQNLKTSPISSFEGMTDLERVIVSTNMEGLPDALRFISNDASFAGLQGSKATRRLLEMQTAKKYLDQLPKDNTLTLSQTADVITNLQKLENLKKEQEKATSESVKKQYQEQIDSVEETIAKTFEESKNNTIVDEQPQQTTQPEPTQETVQGQTTETNLQPEQGTATTEQSVSTDVDANQTLPINETTQNEPQQSNIRNTQTPEIIGNKANETTLPEENEEEVADVTEEEQIKINLERLNAYIEAKKQREQEQQVQVSPSEEVENVQQNETFSGNEQVQTIEQPSETQNAPLVSESKSTNGKYTIRVEQNNGIGTAKILDNSGNEVKLTNKQKEKYVAEHFAKQAYPETVVEDADKLNPREFNQELVKTSNNPIELAQILDSESEFIPSDLLDAKENAIANVIGNKVSRSSFIQFDDANNITFSIAKGYGLTNKGKTIDVIAQEAEVLIYGDWDSQNPRVTTDDVINFMKTYNNGADTFFRQPNPTYRDAAGKFEKLTGIKATKNALDVLLGKKTATKIDFAKLQEEADLLSAEQAYNLEKEYNEWFNSLSLEDKNLELQKTYPYEQRTEENIRESENESVSNNQTESSKNVANQERDGATTEEITQVSPSSQYEGAVTYTQFGEGQEGTIYYENGVAKIKDKAGKVYSANSPLVKNLKDVDGNAIQLQKSNERLTPITKQAFDALVKKLQKAFPRFAKVTYDLEAFKKQAERLGVSISEIQKNIFGSKATILNANFTEFNLYQRAILLNYKGKSRDEILIETGWYLDSDNKWKKLLTPSAEFKEKNIKFDGEYKLSDILDYKSLYQYYPELKNKKIIFNNIDNNLEGYYDGENIIINKSINNEPNEELLNTIVHEIQHVIQRTEGFARGSNYNEATAIRNRLFNSSRSEIDADGELNQAERVITKTFGENWRESLQKGDIAESNIIDAIYFFSHGEAEARLAEKVLNGQIETVKDLTDDLDFYKSIGTIIKFMQTPNGTIYGAKLPDGTIYLNPQFLNANTPIHEFSHLFEQLLPSRFKNGVELLKQTNLGKKLFEQLKQEGNYANLTDEQLWGEALNTHIGNFGENEVNNPKGKLKQLQDWIKDFFAKVGDVLGIKKLSPDTQLRMFTEGVVKDLLGGKPIVAENQVSPSEQVQYSLNENDRKAKQLEIINKTNPAPNSYNTWIRTVNDIKTPEEAFKSAFEDGEMYPDFTVDDMQNVLNTGNVTVYSSYPIKEGVFITPSKMNAEDYAGGRGKKVYSKEINANDVAWIDESEGQYAPVNSSEVKFSINSKTPLSVKEQTEVINDLVANGEDSAFAKLQETNWYKGLSEEQKQNVNPTNIAETIVNAVNSNKRNLEQKVERRDAKIERNLEAIKSVKEVIQQTINDASERGLFKGITSSKVLEYAMRNINKAITPSQQKRVLNTVKKIINDNEYLNKVTKANNLAKKVKKEANSKAISKPLVNIDTAKQFAKINPRNVENIDDYIELANAIIGNLKGISVNNKLEVSNKTYGTDNESILKYIEDTIKYNEKVKEEELKADYNELSRTSTLPVKDMTFDEYKDFINLSKLEENAQKFENNSKATQEERTNLLRATVNRRLKNDFETEILANKSEYSSEEQKIINRISKIDTSKLDYKQLVKLNDVINNAIYNNSFMDAGNISLIAQVQENEKAIDDFKVKNNFNFLSLSDNWATRALQGAISNDMLVEFITNSTTASAFLKRKSGISAVMDGHAGAKVIQQKTVNAFINMKKKVGWKSDTTENRNIRGIYAEMLRSNGGTMEEQQLDWERKKGLIEQTIDGLRDSRNKEDNNAAELLQKVYDKTLKDANNISELEANISKLEFGKFNIDSVKFWIEQHDKYADDFIEQGNIYNNKNLEKELNYTGRKYRPITKDAQKKQDNTLFDEVYRSTEISYKESGSKTKTVKNKFLPKGLVLDLDFDKVQAKMLYDNLYDLKTAEGISLLKNFLSNPENIDRIGGTRNMEALKNMMHNTILAQKQALPFENSDFAKALDKIAGSVMMKSARLALGSVTQLPKQYLSVLVNTSVNLGTDIPLLFEAYRVSGFRNNLELFDKFNIGLRGTTIAGYNKENAIFADENAGAVDKTKAILYDINKASKALYDGTMKALELSDVSIARTTWLAFYMKSLKKQGIDITKIDWNKEHENPNQEAAAFAEQTVSRLQNANDASSMADAFKNTSTYAKVIKNMAMPYSTFAVNQRARMTSDMQKIVHGSIDGRAEALKSLFATLVEQATFNGFKIYILANGAQYLSTMLLTSLFGWDDEEAEDLFKNTKKYTTQKFVTNTLSDFLFSGMGSFTQTGLQLASNKLTKLINGNEYFYNYKNDPEKTGIPNSISALGAYGTSVSTFLGLANDMKYLDGEGDEIVKGGGTNNLVMRPKELSKESKQLVYLTFMIDALALAGLGDQYISQINQKIKKARDKKIKDDLGSYFDTRIYIPSSSDNYKNYAKLRIDKKTSISDIKQMAKKDGAYLNEKTFSRKMKDEIFNYKVSKHREEIEDKLLKYREGKINRDQLRNYVKSLKDLSYDQQVKLWKTFPKENNK